MFKLQIILVSFLVCEIIHSQVVSDTYKKHLSSGVIASNLTTDVIDVASFFGCADACSSRGMECLTFSVTSGGASECRLSRRSSFFATFVATDETTGKIFTSRYYVSQI